MPEGGEQFDAEFQLFVGDGSLDRRMGEGDVDGLAVDPLGDHGFEAHAPAGVGGDLLEQGSGLTAAGQAGEELLDHLGGLGDLLFEGDHLVAGLPGGFQVEAEGVVGLGLPGDLGVPGGLDLEVVVAHQAQDQDEDGEELLDHGFFAPGTSPQVTVNRISPLSSRLLSRQLMPEIRGLASRFLRKVDREA